MVEVNSETDFVARNDLFQGLVKMIADVALGAGTDVEKIKQAKAGTHHGRRRHHRYDRQDRREHDAAPRRLAVGRHRARSAPTCTIRSVDGLGKIGVLVALEFDRQEPTSSQTLGRMVAMHIAAANPQAVDAAGLDPAVVEREKDVLADKFKQQGKPANVIEKIVESGLKTFYKEVCLLEQAYVHDDKKIVAQALKEAEGKVGGPIKITGFVRYALGEGIEKQETDFAAEVAAAAGQS